MSKRKAVANHLGVKPAKQATKKPSPLVKRLLDNVGLGTKKLFILDTNVLMHDPTSLFRFQEHDVFIPMMTLEELDNNKKGTSEVARNARQASRTLDGIVSGAEHQMNDGIPLDGPSGTLATGRLFFQTKAVKMTLPETLPTAKADNQIIGVVMYLESEHSKRKMGDPAKREVILVSKDINMRIKARALGHNAQDYFNDKVLEDTDLLYTGMHELPENFWNTHSTESWKSGGQTFYRVGGPLCREFLVGEFVWQENGKPFNAVIISKDARSIVWRVVRDHTHHKNAIWGIMARNREQNYALNLLLDPEIDFVTLLGQAGTGKTLLTLAAALQQTIEEKRYSEIIFTRVTVPVGEDIGFLPGTEEEKMTPWMGALDDNLDVLGAGGGQDTQKDGESKRADDWGRAATRDLIRSRIKVKSLNFVRGRSFLKKFVIIDEAQNLTPKQMKTLITRAGPGTKVVCLGNIAQIDTPYLTEGSSGLTYVVDRFKGWQHSGHVTLQKGERSRLADHAAEVL